jgi:WD40 repeat protein
MSPRVVRSFGDECFRMNGELLAMRFAADGTAWTVEEPGILRSWDVSSGRALSQQLLPELGVLCTFSADARMLAAGDQDLTLWHVPSGQPWQHLASSSWLTALAFSPDRQWLASGHDDASVRLWQVNSGRLQREWQVQTGPISALAFSRDGRQLAAASEDRTTTLWNVATGKLLGRLAGNHDRIAALAWHPEGTRLIAAGWDSMAWIWDTRTLEPVLLLNGQGEQVSALAFSPDGQALATADSDYRIWIWDPAAGKPIHQLHSHQAPIHALEFHPDGKRLLSGGQDGQLLLWDATSGRPLVGDAVRHGPSARLSLSPDGKHLACLHGSRKVSIWETGRGQLWRQLADTEEVTALCFSPDGRWLATGDSQGQVHVHDAASGDRVKTLRGHHSGITALAFRADGQVLASAGGMDGYVFLWSLTDFEPVLLVPEATGRRGTVESVVFCPGTSMIATGGVDWSAPHGEEGFIRLWDISRPGEAATLASGAMQLAVRPDGRQLACATQTEAVYLWSLTYHTLSGILLGHHHQVTCLAYSPDGSLLASGSEDETVRLWHSDRRDVAAVITVATRVRDLVFSPDGQWIYTANSNGTCSVIDVVREKWVEVTPEG